jgi:molybdate transport system substrate-binding protein
MRMSSLAAAAKIGCLILLAQGAANAAEIKLISAAAFTQATNDLRAQFERTTGHKLLVKSVPGPLVKREIDGGETFDVAISQPAMIDDLIKEDKIVAGTRADIGRAGVGVGVRAGAAKPDVGSVDALKKALLEAKSVGHTQEGATRAHFMRVLDQLGIAEEMKPKLKPIPAGAGAEIVARGEADIIVLTMASIVNLPGVELAGPLPAQLQSYIGFTAGIGAAAKEPEAAKALVTFFTSEQVASLLKAKGMEPIAR